MSNDTPATSPLYPFANLAAVKRANEMIEQHWFSPNTLRFFRSRMESALIAGRWFITSETPDDHTPRRFTVREALPTGNIGTVGEFRQYASKAEARTAIRDLASEAEGNRAPAAPGEYETPARFARRVLAGLVDVPADEQTPAEPGTAAHLAGTRPVDRREYGTDGRPRVSVTLADGARFRVSVMHYPDTTHARLEFTGRHGFDAKHVSGLRERASRVLRELLGDGCKVLAHKFDDGNGYMVQGWSA